MLRELTQLTPSGIAGLASATIALVFIPMLASSLWLSVFTSTACFALAASGVAFMYARLGMVSLAQVALMGVGGWVMLRLYYAFGLPFEVNLLIAACITMLFGMMLAMPALRLRGLYLALVTLMAAGGLEIIFATFQFPNGGTGFWGVQTGIEKMPRPSIAQSDAAYLRYCIVVVALGFLALEAVRRMAPGRAWALIRRSEAAAMAAGVNVTFYKTLAFAMSGLLGGFAGGLLAGSLGLLDGGTFRASESIMLFALAVVGGARYWLGVVIAATLFRILPALLNNWGLDADLSFIIFGAGLLHAVITAPDGIGGQIYDGLKAKFRNVDQGKSRETEKCEKVRHGGNKTINFQNFNIKVRDISVRFGGVVALDRVNANFTASVSGIIGPNGAGKTTLMNVFSGFVTPSSGDISLDEQELSRHTPFRRGQFLIRRSFQKEEIATDLTAAENVMVQIDDLGLSFADKQAEVTRVLELVGMLNRANTLGADLNKFERRLTDLAKCIVGSPKLIMLDEPAGGLSSQETAILGDLILDIQDIAGAKVLVIDHDVELIERICEETLVLDFGKGIAFGPTQDVLNDSVVKAAYLGQQGAET